MPSDNVIRFSMERKHFYGCYTIWIFRDEFVPVIQVIDRRLQGVVLLLFDISYLNLGLIEFLLKLKKALSVAQSISPRYERTIRLLKKKSRGHCRGKDSMKITTITARASYFVPMKRRDESTVSCLEEDTLFFETNEKTSGSYWSGSRWRLRNELRVNQFQVTT